jgi:cysteine desulfurase
MKVYFDNAATTPLTDEVIKEMTTFLSTEYGNPSSIHSVGRSSRARIEKARKVIANGISASLGEIFFTSSATESNNMAIRQAVEHLGVKHIISSPTEHPCVVNTIQDLEKTKGIKKTLLQVNERGEISLDELKQTLASSQEKILVSLMYGNNEIGTMHPMKEISQLCKENNAYLHCDAVQVLGKYPIDVQEIQFDFLSGTGHKFYGPKGSAFVFINQDSLIPPFITGGAQERNMRAGTENVYGIIGLAKAFEQSIIEMEARKEKIVRVRNYMKEKLMEHFPSSTFNGVQEGDFLYHILSVSFPHSSRNEMLIYNLDIKNIAASAGSACSSGTNKGSHVLEAIKPNDPAITIRFSFSYINTKEEVDYVLESLLEIVEQ